MIARIAAAIATVILRASFTSRLPMRHRHAGGCFPWSLAAIGHERRSGQARVVRGARVVSTARIVSTRRLRAGARAGVAIPRFRLGMDRAASKTGGSAMFGGAHDRSRGLGPENVSLLAFPENDPTDGESATAPTIVEPERRLLLAVLTDAIVRVRQLAAGQRKHARRELVEAVRWIRSDDRGWPCSFVNVCVALDLAHEPIRRAVLHWLRHAPVIDKHVTRRGLLFENKRRRRPHATVPAGPVAEPRGIDAAAV
jgi:hypothetical protein